MSARGALALLVLLAAPGLRAAGNSAQDDVQLVEAVLSRDTSDLPSSVINAFMGVNLETIPKKLQKKAKAKRVELHTLKRLGVDKKRGLLRWPEKDCSIPVDSKSNEADVLILAGYTEVDGGDVRCVMDRTKCSERALMCEFSLNIVVEEKVKGRKKWRFFFHPSDPIMVIVAACRKGTSSTGSNFFSAAAPQCD